ncbi:16318_t:CDS:2, partial [Acaulospora morrowiae]
PMAEAVFSHKVTASNLQNRFIIDSAGTAGYHVGENPDKRTIQTCRRHGVPINHITREVVEEDFCTFDYMLCMDNSNLEHLKEMKSRIPGSKAIVKLFGDYDPLGERIIRDPYYDGNESFERNFQQVSRCSEAFLQSLGLE